MHQENSAFHQQMFAKGDENEMEGQGHQQGSMEENKTEPRRGRKKRDIGDGLETPLGNKVGILQGRLWIGIHSRKEEEEDLEEHGEGE